MLKLINFIHLLIVQFILSYSSDVKTHISRPATRKSDVLYIYPTRQIRLVPHIEEPTPIFKPKPTPPPRNYVNITKHHINEWRENNQQYQALRKLLTT